MEQKILQSESKSERLQILRNNAEKSEKFTYPKTLDENYLNFLKNEVVKESIALSKLEEAKKEYMAEHKAQTQPLKISVADNLTKIRSRVEEVEEDVFLLADQEEGMMGYYNAEGVLVYQRSLLQDERQFRIVDESTKTGTQN